GFTLVMPRGGDGETGAIVVNGTLLAVARQGNDNKLEVVTVTITPTLLDATAMADNTVCPNQRTYRENLSLGLSWNVMMTAPRLPRPPDSVPAPTHWCPPTEEINALRRPR